MIGLLVGILVVFALCGVVVWLISKMGRFRA